MQRRHVLTLAGAVVASAALPASRLLAQGVDVEAILRDPAAPTAGNPKGDVTVVAFLDYNCPFCKKAAPDLERAVKEDGRIRLVYKDWPILAESSVVAAQLALAANYQGKYVLAHTTLMNLPGRASTERMSEALAKAGIDRNRLAKDLKAHAGEIGALLKRNNEQAEALGLPGTPVYLVGPFKVAAALDYQGFKDVVQDARARAAEK